MKRVSIIIGIVIALALLSWVVFGRGNGDEGVQVELAPASRMEVIETVTATGRVQPETQVNISADVSAKIINLAVKEGERVEKGQLLLELDRGNIAAAVESARANYNSQLASADAAAENRDRAIRDYERSQALFDQSLESQAALDANRNAAEAQTSEYIAASERINQARAALTQSQEDLAKTRITAPIAGTVSQLNKELGEIAVGSQFQEDVVMVISNLAGMEVLLDVDENDIVAISVGDRASIEVDALPDVTLDGEVVEMANTAMVTAAGSADQTTEFQVKVTILEDNPSLRPGMTASADIITETREDTLAVPVQSVTVRTLDQLAPPEDDEGDEGAAEDSEATAPTWTPDKDGFVELVWVVEDDQAVAKQVKTGIQSDSHIEILKGLAEGDQVVVGSYRAISQDLEIGSPVTTAGDEDES